MIEIKHGSENMCDLLNKEIAELENAMIEELAHTLYCKQDKFDLSNPFDVAKAVVEVMCVKCLKHWVAVYPTDCKLADIECPHCQKQGFVIKTGEEIDFD